MGTPNDTDELKDAPMLRSLSKADPFVVPGGFFDRFPQVVQQRIADERSQRRSWTWSLTSLMKPALGVAALAVVIALVVTVRYNSVDAPSSAAVASYETPDHIADEIEADELNTLLSTDEPLLANVDLTLNEAELAAYLETEELPLDLLIEEL